MLRFVKDGKNSLLLRAQSPAHFYSITLARKHGSPACRARFFVASSRLFPLAVNTLLNLERRDDEKLLTMLDDVLN
ncbi:MAG TPA: hypothetical protein VEW05_18685 [Candidatus Polarisedimenticolia bacterium]|nr:hypothetical protein [Candidatus Polarisedimenticolia bacterium]